MHAKFEGNPIAHFCLLAVFLQVCEKVEEKETEENKNEENEQLFEGLYFRNGKYNLLQICYLFSSNMPAPAQ